MLLNLQLVSKAWKAATPRAFSGHFTVMIQQGKIVKLAKICQDLPSISSLEIQSHQEVFDLSPISSCSGLSSLVLEHRMNGRWTRSRCDREREYLLLDVAVLPSGLRDLRTRHWKFDSNRLQHFKSVGITSLHLSKTRNKVADIYKLLQHLPGLKVKNSFSSMPFSLSCS